MSDVFLSYNREDQSIAQRFAQGFEREGLSVWWMPTLRSGDTYDSVTEKALREAAAVAVLWSRHSAESQWVRAEATIASRGGKLVPAMIEACDRPVAFELTQSADLTTWKGDTNDPAWRAYVADVRGVVERTKLQRADSAPQTSAPAPMREQTHPVARGTSRWTSTLPLVLIVLAVLIGVSAFFILRHGHVERADSTRTTATDSANKTLSKPAPAAVRLAILPLENLSPDPSNAFFTDGLHEEILSALAQRAPGLEVISRTTMMLYRQRTKSLTDVAREIGATHVVEGSVRREAQQVRLTLQLIDARTDQHVWAQTYDRTLVSALSLQSEVASEIAGQLSSRLGGARPAAAARPTTNPEAYDLYLRANLQRIDLPTAGILAPFSTWREIEDQYSRAIALDPTFVAAIVQRAIVRATIVVYGHDASEEQVARARADLDRALQLAADDPEVLASDAWFSFWVDGDAPLALQKFTRAEAAGPLNALMLFTKVSILFDLGRMDEGLQAMERVLTLDPGNPFVIFGQIQYFMAAQRPAEAKRAFELFRRRSPNDPAVIGFERLLRVEYQGQVPPVTQNELSKALAFARRATEDSSWIPLGDVFEGLLVERRFDDARRIVAAVPVSTLRSYFTGPQGPMPVAWPLARVDLLRGDKKAAVADGRALLSYVAHQKETSRNRGYLRVLAAYGYLATANGRQAVESAKEALAQFPPGRSAGARGASTIALAEMLAATGAHDEAVAVLEKLVALQSGTYQGPGELLANPALAIPLEKNARWQALSARLRAQMQAAEL